MHTVIAQAKAGLAIVYAHLPIALVKTWPPVQKTTGMRLPPPQHLPRTCKSQHPWIYSISATTRMPMYAAKQLRLSGMRCRRNRKFNLGIPYRKRDHQKMSEPKLLPPRNWCNSTSASLMPFTTTLAELGPLAVGVGIIVALICGITFISTGKRPPTP